MQFCHLLFKRIHTYNAEGNHSPFFVKCVKESLKIKKLLSFKNWFVFIYSLFKITKQEKKTWWREKQQHCFPFYINNINEPNVFIICLLKKFECLVLNEVKIFVVYIFIKFNHWFAMIQIFLIFLFTFFGVWYVAEIPIKKKKFSVL